MRTIKGPLCRLCREAMERVTIVSDITGYPYGKWEHVRKESSCPRPDVTWEIKDE